VAPALLFSAPALATPRPLPFTYTADTLGEGESEVEQYVDLTPVKATNATTGSPVWYTATQFQTEFEHGITDDLELGLYVAFQPQPGEAYTSTATLTEGTGFKERLRWHALQYGDFGLALYGELVEYETEFEIEAKVILEQRWGKFRLAGNAWVEREFYYAQNQQDWVLNPTIGGTYQITPAFHAGVEYWMRVEFPDPAPHPRPFAIGPNQFVGPALMFNLGHLWWSTGIYARVNDVDRVAQPLDDYGPIWVRTVVGLEL
jgi:hypothetical protein